MIRLGVLASGTKTGGGSGFENLVLQQRAGNMPGVEIVAVGSNVRKGGVFERAQKLSIPFMFLGTAPSAIDYESWWQDNSLDFIALSGYLKPVVGLDPTKIFNIHPGPLPGFGGEGMYGHRVHEAVMVAYHRGEVFESGVSMHFVTPEYDMGPIFFKLPVPIYPGDTAETLGAHVNQFEHIWQPWVTWLICTGQIRWDGKFPAKIEVPEWYRYLPRV